VNSSGYCQTCPNNTYTFDDPYAKLAQCHPCPDNTLCFGGNITLPMQGYSRISDRGTESIKCINEDACNGGYINATDISIQG